MKIELRPGQLLEVRWDSARQPLTVPEQDREVTALRALGMPCEDYDSPEEIEVRRWDAWFTACGLGEKWSEIKAACAHVGQTPAEVCVWARMVEMTRLEGLHDPDQR